MKANKVSSVVRQFTKLRKAKGISVRELSELTGVSRDTISSYETGRRSPKLVIFEKLISAVGGEGLTIYGWEK